MLARIFTIVLQISWLKQNSDNVLLWLRLISCWLPLEDTITDTLFKRPIFVELTEKKLNIYVLTWAWNFEPDKANSISFSLLSAPSLMSLSSWDLVPVLLLSVRYSAGYLHLWTSVNLVTQLDSVHLIIVHRSESYLKGLFSIWNHTWQPWLLSHVPLTKDNFNCFSLKARFISLHQNDIVATRILVCEM